MAKTLKKKNPNGVNQHTLPDPRQIKFITLFFDPKSETYSNCLQSAISAGYEHDYAKNLMVHMPKWLVESVDQMNLESMARKAASNLDEMLDMSPMQPVITATGYLINKKTKKPMMQLNPGVLKVKQDTSKFVSERLIKQFKKESKVSFSFEGIAKDKEEYA